MCSVSADMMKFWDMMYHNISLEYVYVNKIPYQRVRLILEGGAPPSDQEKRTTSGAKPKPKHSVIIPMGGKPTCNLLCMQILLVLFPSRNYARLKRRVGGKDSLVVWHEYKQSHPDCSPLLMYVADGFEEYAQSWRLQGVMTQTDDDLVLGKFAHSINQLCLVSACRSVMYLYSKHFSLLFNDALHSAA